MSRKRMIDPSIWTDEGFTELSITAKLLFIGLISNADDEGRGAASPKSLKALVFPADDVTSSIVKDALGECVSHMRLDVYSVDGRDYYQLENWTKHQRVDKPSKSKIPEHFVEHSPNTPREVREGSGSVRPELKGSELGEKNSPPLPPEENSEGHSKQINPEKIPGEKPRWKYRDEDVTQFVREWNTCGLPDYRKLPVILTAFPRAGEVIEALSYYDADEIVSAIRNYAEVVTHREKYHYGATFSHVANFLAGGVQVFAPSARPLEVMRKASMGSQVPELTKPAEVLVCAHCGTPTRANYCQNRECGTYTKNLAAKIVPKGQYSETVPP